MPLIEVRNLTKIYKNDSVETPALQEVSFSVNKGEFLAIMGASGSGKSTLLHILGFLDRPTEGNYYLEGRTIDDYSPEELAKVRNKKFGFVFQSFYLLPQITVLENIKLPLMYSEIPESEWNKRAEEVARSVGILYRINHEAHQLSGGEKQRVAIARALINNPTVIFADEPTGNLDSESGKIVMEIIQRLSKKEGRTVLLITHETYMAKYADRVILLRDGRITSDKKIPPFSQNHSIK